MKLTLISGLAVVFLIAQAQGVAYSQESIHAGPFYTAAAPGSESPVFPTMQVLIEVPPGSSLDSLQPQNFTLQADGGPAVTATRIQTLSASGHGVAVAVVFDASGSMRGRPLNAIRTGLGRFVDDAGPADLFALETIADDSRWASDWNDSRDHARAAIRQLAGRGHLTRLWDGLLAALDKFPDAPAARRVLVISDGHDEGSSHTLQEVIALARTKEAIIDALGMTRSNPKYLESLQRLASETHGVFRQAKSAAEMQQLVGSGIQRMKTIPVATFVSNQVKADGQAHSFKVTWTPGAAALSDTEMVTVPNIPDVPARPAYGNSDQASWYKNYLLWIAGGLLILLVILAVTLIQRGRRRAVAPPDVAGVPYEPATNPAANPVPVSVPVNREPLPSDNLGSMRRDFFAPQREPAPPPLAHTPAAPTVKKARAATQFATHFPEPAKGRPAAWLLCESGPAAGHSFPIDETQYWIGALENNHLQIASDPTVSGNHACIVFDHDVLGIYDHRSTNGTGVNNEVVNDSRRLLRPGDRIRIGSSVFVLQPAEERNA